MQRNDHTGLKPMDSGNLPPPTAALISGGSSLDPAEFPPVTVTSKAVVTGAGVAPEELKSM